MSICTKLHLGLEALVWVHNIPSVGEFGEVKQKDVIIQELEDFLDITQDDLEVTKEIVLQYVIEPVKLHMKLTVLWNNI